MLYNFSSIQFVCGEESGSAEEKLKFFNSIVSLCLYIFYSQSRILMGLVTKISKKIIMFTWLFEKIGYNILLQTSYYPMQLFIVIQPKRESNDHLQHIISNYLLSHNKIKDYKNIEIPVFVAYIINSYDSS